MGMSQNRVNLLGFVDLDLSQRDQPWYPLDMTNIAMEAMSHGP